MVNFTPVVHNSPPRLRSVVEESDNFENITNDGGEVTEEEVDKDQASETCSKSIESGQFYVILGDCLEGYFIVLCSSVMEDSFSGTYLKEIVSNSNDSLTFKITKEVDMFYNSSIISEITVDPDINKKTNFFVKKVDIDEILLKVAEMVIM